MIDEAQGTPEPETLVDNQATETDAEANDETIELLDTDDETADDETPKDEAPQPRKLKVKIDGQELEVDEEEAARGYQRQADYSRHMQQLAAERQQTQAMQARYHQQLEQFIPESAARYQALQQAAEQYRQEGNFEALAAVQYDMQAEALRYNQANAERERIKDEESSNEVEFRRKEQARTDQALVEAIPEWKNREVGAKELSEARDMIGSEVKKFYGEKAPLIMKDMMDGLYGPMPFVLARKAIQYDKLMAKVAARKAGKSEETSAPAPVQAVRTSGGASKDPSQMSDKEFATWRRQQIAQRN